MKLLLGPKGHRCLTFLVGVRNPRAAVAMAAHGFSEATIREGWRLLARLSTLRFGKSDPSTDPEVIETLDQAENKWFPICKATLEHRYPDVAAALFHNLAQTSGAGVALTVGTFIDRVHEMERGEGAFAGNGPSARELLAERGLTEATVMETELVIAQLQSLQSEPAVQPTPEEIQLAEDALWAWYLEWSTIARVAISDRRVLRSMGFLRRKSGGGEELVDGADGLDETDDSTDPDLAAAEPNDAVPEPDAPVAAPVPDNATPSAPAPAAVSTNEEAGQPAE